VAVVVAVLGAAVCAIRDADLTGRTGRPILVAGSLGSGLAAVVARAVELHRGAGVGEREILLAAGERRRALRGAGHRDVDLAAAGQIAADPAACAAAEERGEVARGGGRGGAPVVPGDLGGSAERAHPGHEAARGRGSVHDDLRSVPGPGGEAVGGID